MISVSLPFLSFRKLFKLAKSKRYTKVGTIFAIYKVYSEFLEVYENKSIFFKWEF